MNTVAQERDRYRRLLRITCAAAVVLPPEVTAWWAAEQAAIDAEETAAHNINEARKKKLQREIDRLKTVLSTIP